MTKFYNIDRKRISARSYTNDISVTLERYEKQMTYNNITQNIITATFHKKPKKENDKEKENDNKISGSLCIVS